MYYEAALQVLSSSPRPLTAQEITDQAIERGLIRPLGKTPCATMRTQLYVKGRDNPELIKLGEPGNGRAKPGSVRWTLRHADADSEQRRVGQPK